MASQRASLRKSGVFWALIMAAPLASATPTVYLGLDNANLSGGGARPNADAAAASFSAATGATAAQDFESFAAPSAVPSSFSIGGTTASFTDTSSDYAQISAGVGTFSTYPTSGSQYLESLTLNGTAYFSVAFDHGLKALGFYITDASDWFNTAGPIPNLQVTLHQASGDVALDLFAGLDPATVNDGNVAFFGVVDASDPIDGFSISNPAGVPDKDAIGIDDLQVATFSSPTAIPSPPVGYLMAAGLLAMRWVHRRSLG